MSGRLISNNVLVAYELMHTFKRKRIGKKGSFAFKLDMSKAYNRVKWGFIEKMIITMGFGDRWVNLIMHCVQLVFYSIMVNGRESEAFCPNRGLRQGEPLSLYLFFIFAEGFSSLLKSAKRYGQF